MKEFNKTRKCWVSKNEMFIPCNTTEFSDHNGNQQAVVHLIKKKQYAKDDTIVSVFGDEYAIRRFLLGRVKGWKKSHHMENCHESTTDIGYIEKEQLSLF